MNNNQITPAGNNDNTLGRRLPSQAEMELRTLNAVIDLLVARNPFTAYSVTLELRNANPGLEVHHEARPGANLTGVRQIVQSKIMPAIISAFPMEVYERTDDWGNPPRPALTYELDAMADQKVVDAIVANKIDLTGMDFTDQTKVTDIDITNPAAPVIPAVTQPSNAVIAAPDDSGKMLLPVDPNDAMANKKGITNLPLIDLSTQNKDDEDDNATT